MAINFLQSTKLPDDVKLQFGDSTDFEIYHDATTNQNKITSLLGRQLLINSASVVINNAADTQNMIIATDLNSPDGAEVRIQGMNYYIDVDNSSGMIHFEDERSRAEKYRVISELARKKATVTVESYELEEGEKDACYRKVKSRYKIWPSAYASGALVKCRKVGAKNWGNKSKKK